MSFAAAMLLALTPFGQPEPPSPLAPPVPPAPPPKSTSDPTASPTQFSIGFEPNCSHSVEVCRRKALAAMIKEGITYAEARSDGSVHGYTSTCQVLVLTFTGQAGTDVFTYVVGTTTAETERLLQAVNRHVKTAETDTKTPDRVGSPKADQLAGQPAICWQSGLQPSQSVGRYFIPVAALSFEKFGYSPVNLGASHWFVAGSKPQPQQALLACQVPGDSALKCRLIVLGIARDPEVCDRDTKAVFDKIVKTLYE
jgi:hypothetical protein